jgi:two-component system NtrC family sensor kinase
MSDQNNPYYIAYLREKQARTEVEQLLEASTRQLYEKNLLLKKQIEQIQQQQESVIQQEKLALLGTVAAGVAHEINNPLAFILSNLETLSDYSTTLLHAVNDPASSQGAKHKLTFIAEDLPELIADTSQGLHRISRIVKNLLFFARTDTDSPCEVQLAEALDFTLQLLQPMLHQTELSRDYQPVSPIRFRLHELNQLLLNILMNAIQACAEVPERANAIQLSIQQQGAQVVFTVTDNGCGMSDETLNRMFDPFFTTKAVGTGTGVGMAIVLQALHQHQCSIEVKSAVGIGTEICIRFPSYD